MNAQLKTQTQPFDAVAFTMAYEQDDLNLDQIVEGFQHMINSGLVWQLQGCYGRMAKELIERGYCHV